MNIISHNCVGAYMYIKKGEIYGNPFMWSVIPPEDFFYLYNHYSEINFDKIEIAFENNFYKVVIDNKVNVWYVHYKYNEHAMEPTRTIHDDVIYYDIENFILERYKTRLSRMFGEPVFVITDREYITNKQWNFTKEDIEKYVNKKDCIVAVYDKTIVGDNVIYMPNKDIEPKEIAEIILKTIGK